MNASIAIKIIIGLTIIAVPGTSYCGFWSDVKEGFIGSFDCNIKAEQLPTTKYGEIPGKNILTNGPNKVCKKVAAFQNNSRVKIIGQKNNWYLVEYSKLGSVYKGWINKDIITLEETSNESQSESVVDQPLEASRTDTISRPLYPKEMVINVQKVLNKKGYDAGVEDGIYGRGTKAAVILFQQENGLVVNGELNQRTLTTLNITQEKRQLTNTQQDTHKTKGNNKQFNSLASVPIQTPIPIRLDSINHEIQVNTSGKKLISKSTAKKLIDAHIREEYSCADSSNRGWNSKSGPHPHLQMLNIWEKLGLAKLKIKKSQGSMTQLMAGGNDTFLKVKFTEKLTDYSLPYIKSNNARCIITGNNLNTKIVDITDAGIVLFSYQYEPDSVGKLYGNYPAKYRGRVAFKYDPFLERFKLAGFQSSTWKEEDWRDDNWKLLDKNTTKVIKGSLK
jgi:hypothetical protein